MKTIWAIGFAIVATLLSVGLIFYLAQAPRGEAVLLRPPPTPLPLQVHVSGGILIPGVYQLPIGSRVLDAVQAAGGFSIDADQNGLNLAAYLTDGDQVIVPTVSSNPPQSRSTELPATSPTGLINLNTASQFELESLPGIGPVLAQEIIHYRDTVGPFQKIEDVLDVKGIGPAKFDKIKTMISVGVPQK